MPSDDNNLFHKTNCASESLKIPQQFVFIMPNWIDSNLILLSAFSLRSIATMKKENRKEIDDDDDYELKLWKQLQETYECTNG